MVSLFESNGKPLTPGEFRALKSFYLNPTETMEYIHTAAGVSYTVLNNAAAKVRHRPYNIYSILSDKGYIKVPPIESLDYQPEHDIQKMTLKLWQDDPFFSPRKIAGLVGYSEISVQLWTSLMYKDFGYKDKNNKKGWTMRMRFFKWVGWLDVDRLAYDVYKYLEANNEPI